MYTNAQYENGPNGQPASINVEINGVLWGVPLDPSNTDYANIMGLVATGQLTISPAS